MAARSRIPDHKDRIEHLIKLEISRILDDLDLRRDFLIDVWSKPRDRGPFLDTIANRWSGLGFADLVFLEPQNATILDTFYREIHEFRFYLMFTEEMPTTLARTYDEYAERITEIGKIALDALGGPPERPLIGGEPRAVPQRVESNVMEADEGEE